MNEVQAEYDLTWKEAITCLFDESVEFFVSTIHQAIDWSRGFQIIEQQLQEIVSEAEEPNLFADKLFQVWLLNGSEVFLHWEIQSQRDNDFEERMYQYNYRAFDRHKKPVFSIAILGDDSRNWRPSIYLHQLDRCQLRFEFATIKLLDYEAQWDNLESSPFRIALIVMAHLKTKATTGNLDERLTWKWRFVRSLFERNYRPEDVILLFRLLDKMMALSPSLQQRFKQLIRTYEEERKMPFLSRIEEEAIALGTERGIALGTERGIALGTERGIALGTERGLELGRTEEMRNTTRRNLMMILGIKFGELPSEIIDTLSGISDVSVLENLLSQSVTINSLQDFQNLLQ